MLNLLLHFLRLFRYKDPLNFTVNIETIKDHRFRLNKPYVNVLGNTNLDILVLTSCTDL